MTPLPFASGTPCLWCGRPIDLTRGGASRVDGDPGWYHDGDCFSEQPVVRLLLGLSSRPAEAPSVLPLPLPAPPPLPAEPL